MILKLKKTYLYRDLYIKVYGEIDENTEKSNNIRKFK